MKAFKPRSVAQQRANYIKACKRRLKREIAELKDIYCEEHERHAKFHDQRCEVGIQILKIQDRVANAADKEFGGWDKWRHNEKLLRLVVRRMNDAVVNHQARIEEIDAKMELCLAEYHAEVKKLSNKYRVLIKTA